MIPAVTEVSTIDPASVRPLRRAEYDTLVEAGCFAYHASVATVLARAFSRGLPESVEVRVQCPFAASADSEPEPDIALVPAGSRTHHPDTAFLVVEVAQSSAAVDRGFK